MTEHPGGSGQELKAEGQGGGEAPKMEKRATDQNRKTCSNKTADQPWVWLRGPVRHKMTVHRACSADVLGLIKVSSVEAG